MARERVILLIYHGQGHFNACFKVAKILSATHEVIFAGHAYFERYIRERGFEYYALTTVPFGLGFEKWVNQQEKRKYVWWHTALDHWTNRLFSLRQKSLNAMLENINPSIVLIDSWQSTDFIALYQSLKRKRIKAALIQTMLSTVVDATPPLTSDTLPSDNKLVAKAHASFRRTKILKQLKDRIKYLGRTNESMIAECIRVTELNSKYKPQQASLFAPALALPEFILAPSEFEFSGRTFRNNQYHIGSMIDIDRQEEVNDNVAGLLLHFQQTKQTFIYCSFGSTDLEYPEAVVNFLPRLISVLEQRKFQCILSSKSERVREVAMGKSAFLHVFDHVPQLGILKQSKFFITHGGLNSIKEAIAFEIPMLVYPARDYADNPGNAARVCYHGLGLMGSLKDDTAAALDARVEKLLTDGCFQDTLHRFNKTMAEKYTAQTFLELLKKIEPVE